MLEFMRNSNLSESASEAGRPKLSSRPRQYVDVNDLRSLLKLGLGLHTLGDRRRRLKRAIDGLARLAGADAWVAMVVDLPSGRQSAGWILMSGGGDPDTARLAAKRIESAVGQPKSSIARLITTPNQTAGRVLAVIADGRAIHSFLRPEGPARTPGTWISMHRKDASPPFEERERRMVELFHSQSAWILLQIGGSK